MKARGLIAFSTDTVYGIAENTNAREDHPPGPIGECGRSKAAMEARLEEICAERRPPPAAFRPGMILGHGRQGVLERLFRLARRNQPAPIFGKGNNFFQVVAAEDCARAVSSAFERDFSSIRELSRTPRSGS